jgi:Pyridoxamine 5'-phosphate oxidase
MIAHVAFVDRGEPVCIPMLYARVGQKVYLHGSRASRAMRRLAEGERGWVTVTMLDGLVLARSAFEHSANYESGLGRWLVGVVHGRAELAASGGWPIAAGLVTFVVLAVFFEVVVGIGGRGGALSGSVGRYGLAALLIGAGLVLLVRRLLAARRPRRPAWGAMPRWEPTQRRGLSTPRPDRLGVVKFL